jgi:hypothetical protein
LSLQKPADSVVEREDGTTLRTLFHGLTKRAHLGAHDKPNLHCSTLTAVVLPVPVELGETACRTSKDTGTRGR